MLDYDKTELNTVLLAVLSLRTYGFMALTGTYSSVIDTKGRLGIPSYFRKFLKETLVVAPVLYTPKDEPVLRIYSEEKWEEIDTKISALVDGGSGDVSMQALNFKRMMYSTCKTVDIDTSGRILLSPPQLEILNKSKNVAVIGQSDKLEVWAGDYWKAKQAELRMLSPEDRFSELDLGGLGL